MPQKARVMGSNPTAAIWCGHIVVDMSQVKPMRPINKAFKNEIDGIISELVTDTSEVAINKYSRSRKFKLIKFESSRKGVAVVCDDIMGTSIAYMIHLRNINWI